MQENIISHCKEALLKWYSAEMGAFQKLPSSEKSLKEMLVIGYPVYGKDYVKTFLEFSLPSLLSPNNLPAVWDKWDIIFIIYTKKEEIPLFKNSIAIKKLLELGVEIHLRLIPEEVLEVCKSSSDKYWILGTAGNLVLQFARSLGAAVHINAPDIVYQDGYFSSLWKISRFNDVITHTNISSIKETVCESLDNYRNNHIININGIDLMRIGLRNMHPRFSKYLMNGKDIEKDLPSQPLIMWIEENKLSIYSPHTNLSYISPAVTSNIPLRLFNTTDSQLPFFIDNSYQLYYPTIKDNLSCVELSKLNTEENKRLDLSGFSLCFWLTTYLNPTYFEIFKNPSVFLLSSAVNFEKAEDVQEKMSKVFNAIETSFDLCEKVFPPEFNYKNEDKYSL